MHRENSRTVLASATLLTLISLCSGQTRTEPEKPPEPKITAVRFATFPKSENGLVTFQLEIDGENLPATTTGVTVDFDTKDPAKPLTCVPKTCEPKAASDGKEIMVEGTAEDETEVTRIRIVQNRKIVADTKKDFTISIKKNPPKPKLPQFEVKLEPETNKEFPNLHTLVITKEGGDADVGFADNPHWMTVDLMPGGGTDITIVQTSLSQMVLHYVAAADYKPTSVAVTVYDGSDLDSRKVNSIAVSKKPAEDPDKPKVTSTEIVFISRSHGVGRVRIFGEGFGDYKAPPYNVDDYLWNCLEEFHIRGTKEAELSDLDSRLSACKDTLDGDRIRDPAGLKTRLDYTKTNLAAFVLNPKKDPEKWTQDNIRDKVSVSIHSRNPDITVEKVEILDINDKMIDVYFEFTRYRGYSYPLRLESSEITIKKNIQKTTQTVKNDKVTGTVSGPKEEVYSLAYEIDPKRDPNLTYKYTILDNYSANTLLGKGVAENFYVLQLSVVNDGEKKVAIPLAAIHAEIEWKRGVAKTKNTPAYVQGPPTLAPISLAAVSSDFEAYQKAKGFRAYLFNSLDAATTVATALVPFAGPSLKDAEVFFSGGFVPGVHKAWGDLSSQQLQNLTSLSWESSETLPAKGGSMQKLIYIQKRSAEFGNGDRKVSSLEIASILGLEITGYEVVESTSASATPAAAKKPASGKTDTPEPANSKSPAPAEPAATPKPEAKKE